MVPNFLRAQFSRIGLLQVFVQIIFADEEPPDLLKCLLITVINCIIRCDIEVSYQCAEVFRRSESCRRHVV